MRVARLKVKNFRGIKKCEIILSGHTVLVGDNNTGKSTIIEAIDLVLGPERLSRYPAIDEHDFYAGQYIKDEEPIYIDVEVVIVDLSDEQQRYFRNHLEWWNTNDNSIIEGPPPESTDGEGVVPALRLGFIGHYDEEEDDFTSRTFFLSPEKDDGAFDSFGTRDKRLCGFLFLRTLRTGSRALSLERGSLLDIILRLQELRLHMWEDVLNQLRQIPVAENPELGITDILSSVQDAVRCFVPSDWAENPHMRVSDLTRADLRRVLTVFMGTGAKTDDASEYAAPFQHQGTGTINTLVLALLSMIAELKQNVIFAMEEPEIAIPPHTQKLIINSVTFKSAQAIFTSHSPYVLQELEPSHILVIRREDGVLVGTPADYPPTIKPKKYREEFRRRFCEALLARRVLITEGRTEYDAFPAAARRLYELDSDVYKSLEALGIAVVNAETDSQVDPLGGFYRGLGKIVFAVFDKQSPERKAEIEDSVDYPYEAPEKGFENVILNGTAETALRRYAVSLVSNGEWPLHLVEKTPSESMKIEDLRDAIGDYLKWSKGSGDAADLLGQCNEDEMPEFIVHTLETIQSIVEAETETESKGIEQEKDVPEQSSEDIEKV
jgi:putative ATP-dependent endonuclease of OLD family